jgi:hypothetical protein
MLSHQEAVMVCGDDSIESRHCQALNTLRELSEQVRQTGEPITWEPIDNRVEKFFECVVYPSPEIGNLEERSLQWTKDVMSRLDMLADTEEHLAQV